MRIISGKYRGKAIIPPRNLRVRPTTDFAKEALFNILHHRLDFSGLRVLDLFSGTGSIGLEFASRDVLFVDMVESNHSQVEFIRRIILDLKMNNARAVKSDAYQYIDHVHQSFDIIFADPPYDQDGIGELPDKILNSELLKPDGWFILEHSKKFNYSDHPNCFDQRVYGSVHFSFFKRTGKN